MILIVDDNPENIFSLKSLLEINKYLVDSAASGEEALRKVLKTSYALIILDVQMPGMDGFEVAEALSGSRKAAEIPIIFLSAVNVNKKWITKGYSSGGIDYVTKPFDPDILLLKVKTFIRLYEQARELNEIQKVLREEIEFKTIAEAGLKQSVDELRSILQSIQQIAFTTRADGKIDFVNQQWFEYAEEKNDYPMARGDCSSVQDLVKLAINSGEPLVKETCIRSLHDSEYRYFLLGMTPVRKDDVVVKWVGIFTDIHEQKMAEQILENKVNVRTAELQIMNHELESRNSELQQFAFVASHDLQEPLRKIQVFSNIIKDKCQPGDTEMVSYLERVISSSDRMRRLINDLLNYSRLQSEELFDELNLNVLMDTIVSDLDVAVKSKNATITFANLPVVEANATQLQQVFQNLITNALKFAKDDVAPVITIEAERVAAREFTSPTKEDGDFVRISVRDNGIGFNQEYVDRIFTIFQRLASGKKYEVTGIGLAIVRKVIEKHKGIITANSSENEGATFTIVLPLRQTPVAAVVTQNF